MTEFTLNNCDEHMYRWLSPSTIEWVSTDMIPIGAFSHVSGDISLMLAKGYKHSIDESHIHHSIRIYVHYSNAETGPDDRPYCLWSEEGDIPICEDDDFAFCGFQVEDLPLYVLPVKKERHEPQYDAETADNAFYLPTVTFPEQPEPTMLTDLHDEPVAKPVKDWC